MKLLNRGFIIVSPKTHFINEILLHTTSKELLTPRSPEPTVYLIEEDFWDDDIVLKKYVKRIITAEIKQIEPEKEISLSKISFDNIHDYFDISMGSLVLDLEDRSIERITDD